MVLHCWLESRLGIHSGNGMKRQLWIVLGGMMLSLSVHAASFDCAKAATKVEKLICSDAELSKLDEEMNTVYKTALQDAKHADVIKQEQKQWMKRRNDCPAADCLKGYYERQLSMLKVPIVTSPAGKPITVRDNYTATRLPNGKVLIVGGTSIRDNYFISLDNSELYDPATDRFIATNNHSVARSEHTATLLQNGKVLLVGGDTEGGMMPLHSAELYDPVSDTFSATGGFSSDTSSCSATLMANGKVLLIGQNMRGDSTAEIYDPATGSFTGTGSPAIGRCNATTTLLPSGKVLLAGGIGGNSLSLASAELYDPITGTFTVTGSLSKGHAGHTATLLPSGKVLVAGGSFSGAPPASVEIYNPTTGSFAVIGELIIERHDHTATLLKNGNVLIAGGTRSDGILTTSLELYNPAAGTSTSVGRLSAERIHQTATLLPNGKVLIVGSDIVESHNTSELYDPTTSK